MPVKFQLEDVATRTLPLQNVIHSSAFGKQPPMTKLLPAPLTSKLKPLPLLKSGHLK